MTKLDDVKVGTVLNGVIPNRNATITSVQWHGTDVITINYRDSNGINGERLLYRSDENSLEIVETGRPWSFSADGKLFRLVAEADRIQLAHLFDPLMAVHSSNIDPLPHQISAVYEHMLPRQPLRYLLADDPGAGKTIMAGLLIKEMLARGDLRRCLIVCPGSLAEQWQDELMQKFNLPFDILTNDALQAARSNWFIEHPLAITRLDKLSRNEEVQKLAGDEDAYWDLIVCDEAHKMSARYFNSEIKKTKRYNLGQALSSHCRNFLLMTATPHNGIEADFQLFLALLDGDRFEGRFRDGVHQIDVSDIMRRMVKEDLVKFDGKPLFPERIAYTKPYQLSDLEALLYKRVTEYVKNEYNRAAEHQDGKRKGTVGFALTMLQRRLASSPEAIYKSLERRKARLEKQLREQKLLSRGAHIEIQGKFLEEEDLENLDELTENEIELLENEIFDQATAARTIEELRIEIETIDGLVKLASEVRTSDEDTKWTELSELLTEIFTPIGIQNQVKEDEIPYIEKAPVYKASPRQKLVIFTEHKDTLYYLEKKISTLLGRPEAIVCIHGGIGRDLRRLIQNKFRSDPDVQVLIATDAAGEGINLQRAHLMINYDLPWNPNRIEQRFGRIHRIGQNEVCHLWNLVAQETREGDVYRRLLNKIEQARQAMGGKIFDVLGKVEFDENKTLRDLMMEAIRYGDQPETREKLNRIIDNAFNRQHLEKIMHDHALEPTILGTDKVFKIRDKMEQAEARRLQPHYIETFFREAFKQVGGEYREREINRFEIKRVPPAVRSRDRQIGRGTPVLSKYERVVFDKALIQPLKMPPAQFITPGHPLLNSLIDLIRERNMDLLKQGTVLVNHQDDGTDPKMLFFIEHSIHDGTMLENGNRRTVSKRKLYIEMDSDGNISNPVYAPYLDYRPLESTEPDIDFILKQPECSWVNRELEKKAVEYAITEVSKSHLQEVSNFRQPLIEKTRASVRERLIHEISYWDHRAQELKAQEQAGKVNARLNSRNAERRADDIKVRLENRMKSLDEEEMLSSMLPVVVGGSLVIPYKLMNRWTGKADTTQVSAKDTQAIAAKARNIVMDIERKLGYQPIDREHEKVGYDIESRDPKSGKLRFIEVKGRYADADTVTLTYNEINYFFNKPESSYLALVLLNGEKHTVHYLFQPFKQRPDFNVASINYKMKDLLKIAREPY